MTVANQIYESILSKNKKATTTTTTAATTMIMLKSRSIAAFFGLLLLGCSSILQPCLATAATAAVYYGPPSPPPVCDPHTRRQAYQRKFQLTMLLAKWQRQAEAYRVIKKQRRHATITIQKIKDNVDYHGNYIDEYLDHGIITQRELDEIMIHWIHVFEDRRNARDRQSSSQAEQLLHSPKPIASSFIQDMNMPVPSCTENTNTKSDESISTNIVVHDTTLVASLAVLPELQELLPSSPDSTTMTTRVPTVDTLSTTFNHHVNNNNVTSMSCFAATDNTLVAFKEHKNQLVTVTSTIARSSYPTLLLPVLLEQSSSSLNLFRLFDFGIRTIMLPSQQVTRFFVKPQAPKDLLRKPSNHSSRSIISNNNKMMPLNKLVRPLRHMDLLALVVTLLLSSVGIITIDTTVTVAACIIRVLASKIQFETTDKVHSTTILNGECCLMMMMTMTMYIAYYYYYSAMQR
jgi:hypothetical protein